jgi:hypothetical protein
LNGTLAYNHLLQNDPKRETMQAPNAWGLATRD